MRINPFCWLVVLTTAAGACHGSASISASSSRPRNIVANKWDTLFIAGGSGINDTLFAGPNDVAFVDSVVVVGDDMAERLIALDRTTGRVKWSFGRKGAGPGEFRGIAGIAVTQDDLIWVLDFGNGRIAELAPDGEFHGVRTLHHLPAVPTAILPLDDGAIAMNQGLPANPFMEIGLDSLELRRSFPLAWPDAVPDLANTRVVLAGGPGETWVSAFVLGPGFIVWRRGASHPHRYRDVVPWANRTSPEIRRMHADSARYGAVSLQVVANEIYMLFGGRPVRRAHSGEPTVWVDTYALDGRYLRSYRLPFGADAMTTDGHTFYLLPSEGIPRLVALRPIEE